MGWTEIKDFVVMVFAIPEVQFLLGHIVLNTTVAVAAAIVRGEFKLHRLAEFLWKKIAPFVLVYGVARFLGEAAGVAWLAPAIFTLLETTLLADLAENLEVLGVPLPEFVSKLVRKDGWMAELSVLEEIDCDE